MIEQTRKAKRFRREARSVFDDVTKWELVQFRITPDLKEDIMAWCRRKGLTLSCYLRMVCAKTIDNERSLHDDRQLKPIENAVAGVSEYLPWARAKKY